MILRNSTNSKFSFQRQKSVHELEVAAATATAANNRAVLMSTEYRTVALELEDRRTWVDKKTCSDVR